MPYMTGLDFKGYENREKKLKDELGVAHKEIEKLKKNIQPAPYFEETNFFLLRQIDKMQARIQEKEAEINKLERLLQKYDDIIKGKSLDINIPG